MKNSEFGVIVVVAILIVSVIGGTLYYFNSNSHATITASSVSTTQASLGLVWYGTVDYVNANGGQFTISGVLVGNQGAAIGESLPQFYLTSTPSQSSQLQYGQSVDIIITYVPLNRVLYESVGNVSAISTDSIMITPGNSTVPSFNIPLSWNPRVGDQVTLSI